MAGVWNGHRSVSALADRPTYGRVLTWFTCRSGRRESNVMTSAHRVQLIIRSRSALEVAAHAYPWPPVRAHCGFSLPDRPQPRGDLGIVKDPEPAPGVVGRVPGHVRKGGQGQRGQAVSRRPVRGVVQQRPAQPAPGAAGVDGDLLRRHSPGCWYSASVTCGPQWGPPSVMDRCVMK
jgi:hypothetical protein